MPVAIDSCASFEELFSDVSASSFTISGNLVLLSSKKIAKALSDGFARVPGKSRTVATRNAIAAFFQHFKDQFDAVAVFPPTKLSGYTTSTHFAWQPDYTGAPKKLRSAIVHNLWTGHSAFAFKHELLHRFGVFNKLIPKMLGKTASIRSHWGLVAVGNAGGQLGGWPRSAVDCTNGKKPDKTTGCPDGKLRFAVGEGDPGANNDGNTMSEFELLMAGLIKPDEVSGDLIVCDTQSSNMRHGGEVVQDNNGKKYIVGDCASGIKFVSPTDLEANWQLADSEDVRLTPLGKSDPNLRVVALVVYDSDAALAEALSTGEKGKSDLRDAKQWLDKYLGTLPANWAKDTTVNGKQLSSLSFAVAECDRIGKADCGKGKDTDGKDTSKGESKGTDGKDTSKGESKGTDGKDTSKGESKGTDGKDTSKGSRGGLRLRSKRARIELGPTGDVKIERTGNHTLSLHAHLDVQGLEAKNISIGGVSLSDYINQVVAEATKTTK